MLGCVSHFTPSTRSFPSWYFLRGRRSDCLDVVGTERTSRVVHDAAVVVVADEGGARGIDLSEVALRSRPYVLEIDSNKLIPAMKRKFFPLSIIMPLPRMIEYSSYLFTCRAWIARATSQERAAFHVLLSRSQCSHWPG